jgi:hypothetical protein
MGVAAGVAEDAPAPNACASAAVNPRAIAGREPASSDGSAIHRPTSASMPPASRLAAWKP